MLEPLSWSRGEGVMSKSNLGWLYYKEMYRNGDDTKHIETTLNKIFQATGSDEHLSYEQSFKLETTYPGLIIGSGYAHGLKNDNDAKIGFYFDHTSGFPIIPGSSIKGTLRSLFGLHAENKNDKYQKEKEELIRDLTGKEHLDVKLLVDDIFEGKDEKGDPKSIYQRDIFYEARVSNLKITDDYLAPHKEPLKNPIPIKFIKIAGGVNFEFSFKLHDGGGLSADEKLKLFFQLLQLHGVGAKTNVGYGQFKEKSDEELQAEKALQEDRKKSYVGKIFTQYNNNAANIIQAYETGALAGIESHKEELKEKLLEQLKKDFEKTKNKFKHKVEKRIEKVKGF